MSKTPCPHTKNQYYCVACKGGGICDHLKRKLDCRVCSPAKFCLEHGRRKTACRDCNGGPPIASRFGVKRGPYYKKEEEVEEKPPVVEMDVKVVDDDDVVNVSNDPDVILPVVVGDDEVDVIKNFLKTVKRLEILRKIELWNVAMPTN